MHALAGHFFLCGFMALGSAGHLLGDEALTMAGVRGGLVVQLGATESDTAARLSQTGRYVVHVLDSDIVAVQKARVHLKAEGIYGLAFAETLTDPARLPYTENVVNVVVLRSPGDVPLAEVFRVLTPGGTLVVATQAGFQGPALEAAGFKVVSRKDDESLQARKPWPDKMDAWSHPRHAADGNPVSQDTAVGPPERVRWVVAAMSEVEGLVTEGGRNFYGGVLARDSFNGLRLWHRDLQKGRVNDPAFNLPRLTYDRARPVASGSYLFAVVQNKLVALDAATGEVVREYPGIGEPKELVHRGEVIVAGDDTQISAFSTETAQRLWQHSADNPRNLAAHGDTVCFIRGRPARGQHMEAFAVDLRSGDIQWQCSHFPWLDKVYRVVMSGDQVAFEVSSLSDHDAGNALHVLAAATGELLWEKVFPPGMNHQRQARAMFTETDLWILHGGKENTATREGTTRSPIQVSALNPKTGEILRTWPAGLTHCFPPVATPRYMLAGVMDMTDLQTGDLLVNPITKANCSREGGWVPANGLIYTTPKHCTCWPMLRGFVALAPASPDPNDPVKQPVDQIDFPLVRGPASPNPEAADPGSGDWPTYRGDRWRSGSATSDGPSALQAVWEVKVTEPETLPPSPILFDWRENPFVKGPVSAPSVANGRVFVAHSDAHEILALKADTGQELWRFTARGRIDTPPTIHRGLALFGCHAGYVYALRADSGELVWEFRAAPVDQRIVAFGQVESAWPVPGAVLVRDQTAYFVAGRQPLADGGVLIFAVDPLTGQKQWIHRLDHIPHKPDLTGQNPYQGFYENSGLEFDPVDILHQEGDGIAMSRWIVSRDGRHLQVDKWNAFAKLDTGGGPVWVPRGSWTYGARHQDRFRGEAPRRPLVVFRDGQVFGQLNGSTDLFRRDFDQAALERFDSKWITGWTAAQQGNKGGRPYRTHRIAQDATWTVDAYTAAEVKAEALKPGTQLYNDIHALALARNNRLYAVHKDGRLKVINTDDGSVVNECRVPSPMWDGLAIAQGKLFLSTVSGGVMCLGNTAN